MATKAYFDNIKEHIITHLEKAETSIKVAVAWFTDADLFEILSKKAKKGLRIELLLANHPINHNCSIDYDKLKNAGGKLYFIGNGEENEPIMHHKFCIIDSKTLIFGSYNWTNRAKANHENITIIDDNPTIILDYNDEFEKLRFNIKGEPTKKEAVKDPIKKLSVSSITPFNEGLARISRHEKYGFIDKKGNEVIKCIYDYLEDFSDGFAKYQLGKDYGYINKKGETVVAGWDFTYIYQNTIIQKNFTTLYDDDDEVDKHSNFPKGSFTYLSGITVTNEDGFINNYKSSIYDTLGYIENYCNVIQGEKIDVDSRITFFDNYFFIFGKIFNLDGEDLEEIIGARRIDYHEKRNSGSEFIQDPQDDDYYDFMLDYEDNNRNQENYQENYEHERNLCFDIICKFENYGERYLAIYTENYYGTCFNFIKDFDGNIISDEFDECGMLNQDYVYIRKKNNYSIFHMDDSSNIQNISIKENYGFKYEKPYFSSGLIVFKHNNGIEDIRYIEIYNIKGELIITLKGLLDNEIRYITSISDFHNNIAFIHSGNENVYVLRYNAKTNKVKYLVEDGKKITLEKKTFTPKNQCYKFQEGFAFVRFKDDEFDSIINTNYDEVFSIEYL